MKRRHSATISSGKSTFIRLATCAGLQCLSRYTLLAWVYAAVVAAIRPDFLSHHVINVGFGVRLDTLCEVCFLTSICSYVSFTVLRARQW
jgi:hypothetical protein